MTGSQFVQYGSVRHNKDNDDQWSCTFTMPLSTSEDAPHFVHSQPSEVHRFLRVMESLFEAAGIDDDIERKEMIIEYFDAQTV